MFNRSPNHALQQLSQLRQQGSKGFQPEPHLKEYHLASNPFDKFLKSLGWLNSDHRVQQTRKQGEGETIVQGSQVDGHVSARTHQIEVDTQMAKHHTEIRRTVIDNRKVKRGQRHLQKVEAYTFFETCDSIEVCTYYYAEQMDRLKEMISDAVMRKDAEAELRLCYRRALTRIRMATYGRKFDPDEGVRGADY